MKPLGGYKDKGKKQDVQASEAKYWSTLGKKGRPFTRPDGTVSTDKTRGFHSRPGKKEAIRNENRSLNKRARQRLKDEIKKEINCESDLLLTECKVGD